MVHVEARTGVTSQFPKRPGAQSQAVSEGPVPSVVPDQSETGRLGGGTLSTDSRQSDPTTPTVRPY